MSEEKTEKPTTKRRKESRKEGQVARTQELGRVGRPCCWSGWCCQRCCGRELEALRELIERPASSAERLGDPPSWPCRLLNAGLRHIVHDAGDPRLRR